MSLQRPSAVSLAYASPPCIRRYPSLQVSDFLARASPLKSISAVKGCLRRHLMDAKHPWRVWGEWRAFIWLKYNDFNVITPPTHLLRIEPPSSAQPVSSSSSFPACCGCVGKPYRSRSALPPLTPCYVWPNSCWFGCRSKWLLFLYLTGLTQIWQLVGVFGVEALFVIPRLLDSDMAVPSPVLELLAYTPVDGHILVVLAELLLCGLDGGHESSVRTCPGVVFGVVRLKFIEFGCAQSRTSVLLAATASSLRRTAPCTPSAPPASAPCPPASLHPYERRPPGVAVHLRPHYLFRGVGGRGLVAAHAVV